jgi:5'(3')-deoxyribonucleotidase
MPNKTVILGVDGVVADFTGHLLNRLNSSLSSHDITNWGVFSFLGERGKKDAEQILGHPSFWRELPVLPGALNGVHVIRQAGFEVVWCTSPWFSCETWTTMIPGSTFSQTSTMEPTEDDQLQGQIGN